MSEATIAMVGPRFKQGDVVIINRWAKRVILGFTDLGRYRLKSPSTHMTYIVDITTLDHDVTSHFMNKKMV